MPGADPNVHELSVASSYDSLDEVVTFVENEAQRLGAADADCIDLVMSATEAVNNAIQHGNKEADGKQVHIRIESEPGRLIVWVKDEGEGFEPDSVPDPTTPGNLLSESGRGILMMKAFMDQVDFLPWERGMSVRMVKALTPHQD